MVIADVLMVLVKVVVIGAILISPIVLTLWADDGISPYASPKPSHTKPKVEPVKDWDYYNKTALDIIYEREREEEFGYQAPSKPSEEETSDRCEMCGETMPRYGNHCDACGYLRM